MGILGIEAGGTRTTARFERPAANAAIEKQFGPANLRLIDDRQLARHFQAIARVLPLPDRIAIGMAGARTEADRERIRSAAARAWPGIPCLATNDLETALMAADETPARTDCRVLILSGTGSCCFGRNAAGRTAKVGGWGHVLGDKGSAYEIGLRALKAVVYYSDRDGTWPALGQRLLRALLLNDPNDLIDWVRSAGKDEVARLAIEVFAAWMEGDRIAADILTGAAASLARDAAACARRLSPKSGRVHFVLAGGTLQNQPRFARLVRRNLLDLWRGAAVTVLNRSGVLGAVALARQMDAPAPEARRKTSGRVQPPTPRKSPGNSHEEIRSSQLSVTERRNPRSWHLDRMSIGEAIELMLAEDAQIPKALLAERSRIARAVAMIVRSLRKGGRLFYVGAGTSGRLGVLDASECPPTFRTPPEWVQGIIAGGRTALWTAAEGAEDDPEAGGQALRHRGLSARDTVVGIATSGRTPFVWGALDEARQAGAGTILLCFNPDLIIPRRRRPTLVIAPSVGPEILTGSTRLKAGTATKLVLNMLTTLAMVQLGKVRSNLMIDVKATNVKLRDRAVRITCELTGVEAEAARAALVRNEWRIADAEAALRQNPNRQTATGRRLSPASRTEKNRR